MIYGHNKTIHSTQNLNVEIDEFGKVVSVWFRCCALPFDATEMTQMSNRINQTVKLNAVDIETKSL